MHIHVSPNVRPLTGNLLNKTVSFDNAPRKLANYKGVRWEGISKQLIASAAISKLVRNYDDGRSEIGACAHAPMGQFGHF